MRSMRCEEVATAPMATVKTTANMMRYCLAGTPATRSVPKMIAMMATPVPRSP